LRSCVSELGSQLGAHQDEIGGIGRLTVWPLLDAVVHVGDPLGGQRVSAQISRRIVLVEAAELLQSLEETAHATDVVAGFLEQLQADPIGLSLEVARIVQLMLNTRRLARDGRAYRRVRIAARRQDGDGQSRQPRQLALALLADHARQMALGDMGDLVRQHRCEFGLRLCREYQPGMDSDIAARHGKGIQGGIAQGEELELLLGLFALPGQPAPKAVEVAVDLGIIHVARLAQANVAHDAFTDAALHLWREIQLGGFAEVGQTLGQRGRRGREQQGEQGRNRPMVTHEGYDTGLPAPVRRDGRFHFVTGCQ